MNMPLGSLVHTRFCSGYVKAHIDGRERRDWHRCLYYVIDVDQPEAAQGTTQIVREDELEEPWWKSVRS